METERSNHFIYFYSVFDWVTCKIPKGSFEGGQIEKERQFRSQLNNNPYGTEDCNGSITIEANSFLQNLLNLSMMYIKLIFIPSMTCVWYVGFHFNIY